MSPPDCRRVWGLHCTCPAMTCRLMEDAVTTGFQIEPSKESA